MRPVRLFAAALIAVSAFAADAPLPELRTVPKTAGSIFYIHNSGTQPVTAFLIELVEYPGSSFTLWQDDPRGLIAPGATLEIPTTNMTVGAVPDYVKLRAAMYADGSTAGVPESVVLLTGRRRAILETTRELIGRIGKAGSAAAAKADLTQWSDGMPALTRLSRTQAVGVNQLAAKALIADTVKGLDGGDTNAVLGRLRENEHLLAAQIPK